MGLTFKVWVVETQVKKTRGGKGWSREVASLLGLALLLCTVHTHSSPTLTLKGNGSPSDWWHLPWVDSPTPVFLVAGLTPGLWNSRPEIANKQASQPFVLGWTLEGEVRAIQELALSHRGSQFA